MTTFLQWLNMGGYAFYVWSAYGLVFSGLGLLWWSLGRQKKQLHKQLQRWFGQQKI